MFRQPAEAQLRAQLLLRLLRDLSRIFFVVQLLMKRIMKEMNVLCAFFKAQQKDGRIGITHIALFASLIYHWYIEGSTNPLSAFSRDIMKTSKIKSHVTYFRCIKELSDYGYIIYKPSFKKTQASKIYFMEE